MPAGSVSSFVRAVERPDLLAGLGVEHGVRRQPGRGRRAQLAGLRLRRQRDDALLAGVERRLERVRQFRPDRRVEIGAAGGARDGLQLPARGGVDDEADGVNGDALGGERLRGHHRIALAGLLAVADQHDDALLGVGREIVRCLPERIGDRRVALRLRAVHRRRDGAAAGARPAPNGTARCVSWQFFWLAADCAPYMRNDSCACAGTKPATPLIARCATAMRVSPFGSLAFMLPDASRINRTERSAVLQDWASAAVACTPAASVTRHAPISFCTECPLKLVSAPISGSRPSYPAPAWRTGHG